MARFFPNFICPVLASPAWISKAPSPTQGGLRGSTRGNWSQYLLGQMLQRELLPRLLEIRSQREVGGQGEPARGTDDGCSLVWREGGTFTPSGGVPGELTAQGLLALRHRARRMGEPRPDPDLGEWGWGSLLSEVSSPIRRITSTRWEGAAMTRRAVMDSTGTDLHHLETLEDLPFPWGTTTETGWATRGSYFLLAGAPGLGRCGKPSIWNRRAHFRGSNPLAPPENSQIPRA